MPRLVLIPVDGSKNSQRAFDFYLSDIRHADDVILLCHIQETPSFPADIMPLNDPTEAYRTPFFIQLQKEVRKSQEIIMNYKTACDQANMSKKVLIKGGKPGEAIVAQAAENHTNLIVMGSRGQNAVRRTFLGSVSDYVIHHAHIPVLVVPPQE